jgi:hypothetical protein
MRSVMRAQGAECCAADIGMEARADQSACNHLLAGHCWQNCRFAARRLDVATTKVSAKLCSWRAC